MNCINCNEAMKLVSTTKTKRPSKFGVVKFGIRKYACTFCDYTETVYGSQGVDSRLIDSQQAIEKK